MSTPGESGMFALKVLGSFALGIVALIAFLLVALGVPFLLGEALALLAVMRPMEYARTYERLANFWGLCHVALCALAVFGWYFMSRVVLAMLGKARWSPTTMGGAAAVGLLLLLYALLPLGMLVCLIIGK
jgi:hypothetical protein